jgi:glycoprotein 2-beta-D-xylosyltransferase
MHPERVHMAVGGEKLEAVMGRSEEEELPRIQPGFFEAVAAGYEGIRVAPGTSALEGGGGATPAGVLRDRLGALGQRLDQSDRYKRDLLLSLALVPDAAAAPRTVCAQRVRATVVLVTRMEYANLFHTSTDWYNVWSAARSAGLAPTLDFVAEGLTPRSLVTPHTTAPKFNAHVVFLDGHNAGPMDEGWLSLFLSVSYAKHFEGPTCFDRVVYAPFGYVAAISAGIQPMQQKCRTDPHVRRFSDDFVRGLGLAPRARSTCGAGAAAGGAAGDADAVGAAPTKVVFVQRTHYLAHPRHNGKIVRRLDNEDEIVQSLTAAAAGGEAGVELLRGVFSEMTLREQVRVAQQACVMAGAHGAGLSHVLFAPPGVHVLELQPPAFARPHFIACGSPAAGRRGATLPRTASRARAPFCALASSALART